MIRFDDIFEKLSSSYAEKDILLLKKAYVFAAQAHKGQTRRSGEPYLSHSLEVAKMLASAGFRTIQLFLSQTDSKFWRYNSRADVSSLTADRCKAIAETYRGAGLRIHSIGVYTNLIHPDATERAANLEYFDAMMAIGGHMGVRTFITEAGHYHDPAKPEPAVPVHFQDAVWPQTIATVRDLAARAEKHDAKVLLEPFYRGFFATAKRTRLFLEEVNSPRIRALLDPDAWRVDQIGRAHV